MAQMNLSTEKKIMDLENRLVVPGGRGRSGREWELGVNRCKLLLMEWIHNEIRLRSTENYKTFIRKHYGGTLENYT